jgi:hypothetical protein
MDPMGTYFGGRVMVENWEWLIDWRLIPYLPLLLACLVGTVFGDILLIPLQLLRKSKQFPITKWMLKDEIGG